MKNSLTTILFLSLVVISGREVCLSIDANNPRSFQEVLNTKFYVERSKRFPEPKRIDKVMDHFIEPEKIVPVPNKHFVKRALGLKIVNN